MELTTVYKDKEVEVQMIKSAAEYIEYIVNTYKRLSPIQMEEVLSIILREAAKDYSLKDKKIITTSQISILSRKKIFDLLEPYDIFDDAVLLLSEAFDLTKGIVSDEWKNNIKNYIKAHYFLTFQKKCDIIFFSEKIYDITLSIILIEDDKIFILPIALNEDDFYCKLL